MTYGENSVSNVNRLYIKKEDGKTKKPSSSPKQLKIKPSAGIKKKAQTTIAKAPLLKGKINGN